MGRVTIVDVAKAAGVSTSTASVALRGERGVSEVTRARVADVADRLGYRVDHRARQLREHHSRTIGVTFTPAHSFHADVVTALYEAAGEADLVLSAVTPERDATAAVESLLRDRCSALLLISPDVNAADVAGWARQVRVALLASPLQAEGAVTVATDEAAGMAAAVDHLVGLGHRRILHLDGGDGVMTAQRVEGYRAAMHAHGLPAHVARGGTDDEAGIAAAEALLVTADRPTAVVTYNDMAATGLLLTLRAAGVRVPEDVAVVGYDDTRTARLSTVDLTSVSQNPVELSRSALAALAGEDFPVAVPATRPRLVARSSTLGRAAVDDRA